LVRSDEEGIKTQEEKVSNFSDEEYASYKEELEAIKISIANALKEKANTNGDNGNHLINLEGDNEVTVKDIGEALADLFNSKKESK